MLARQSDIFYHLVPNFALTTYYPLHYYFNYLKFQLFSIQLFLSSLPVVNIFTAISLEFLFIYFLLLWS